jgi:hypothetical protein
MSNPNLKEIIRAEYSRCASDPVYFLKKYALIQHPSKGTIPFHLFPFQEECIREFKDHPKNLILKCRQMGISTLTAGYSLWLMIFHRDKSVLVIATKQDVAKNMVTKVRFMNDNLPSWLRLKESENNRTSLRLSNGSQIKAVSSSGDAGRSEALSLLVIDEAAFIDGIDDIWTSVQPAMTHGGGNAIVLSTPNGIGNWFHKMWVESETGKQKINPITLHWKKHPEYDQEWRDNQETILGARAAAQECDCDFISSGNSVIDLEILQWYEMTHMKEPINKEYVDGNYWRWEHPNFNRQYIVSADVARGDGADYSTVHVIDAEACTQVAEYQGKIDTKEFGNLLVQIATEWNNAFLIVENATIGWAALQQVIHRDYKNLFYMTEDMKYLDTDKQISNKYRAKEKRAVAGFTTSTRTRPLIISKLDLYFREKTVIVRSKRTITELMTFIWHNGKAQATDGYNDDLTMALAIGLWVRDTALMLKQQGIEISKLAMDGMAKPDYKDAPVISTGGPYRGLGTPVKDPYTMDMGDTRNSRRASEDIRWLL